VETRNGKALLSAHRFTRTHGVHRVIRKLSLVIAPRRRSKIVTGVRCIQAYVPHAVQREQMAWCSCRRLRKALAQTLELSRTGEHWTLDQSGRRPEGTIATTCEPPADREGARRFFENLHYPNGE
jgi:hypothetical protein